MHTRQPHPLLPRTRAGRLAALGYLVVALALVLAPPVLQTDPLLALHAVLLTAPTSVVTAPLATLLADAVAAHLAPAPAQEWDAPTLVRWCGVGLAVMLSAGTNVVVATWAAHARDDR